LQLCSGFSIPGLQVRAKSLQSRFNSISTQLGFLCTYCRRSKVAATCMYVYITHVSKSRPWFINFDIHVFNSFLYHLVKKSSRTRPDEVCYHCSQVNFIRFIWEKLEKTESSYYLVLTFNEKLSCFFPVNYKTELKRRKMGCPTTYVWQLMYVKLSKFVFQRAVFLKRIFEPTEKIRASPEASFLNKFLRLRKRWRLCSVACRCQLCVYGFFKKLASDLLVPWQYVAN
jgi:hypothetical protein